MASISAQQMVDNIAQYTSRDFEVRDLSNTEKVDYGFFLLKYNPNDMKQVSKGLQAIKDSRNPINVLNMLRSPKKFGDFLTALVIIIALFALVIFTIVYLIFIIKNEDLRKECLTLGGPILIGIIIMILLLNLFYGTVSKEIVKTYLLLPSNGEKYVDRAISNDEPGC